MLEPFWIIVALIAIATVLLFPIRMWYVARYDRDARGDDGAEKREDGHPD